MGSLDPNVKKLDPYFIIYASFIFTYLIKKQEFGLAQTVRDKKSTSMIFYSTYIISWVTHTSFMASFYVILSQ